MEKSKQLEGGIGVVNAIRMCYIKFSKKKNNKNIFKKINETEFHQIEKCLHMHSMMKIYQTVHLLSSKLK